MISFSLFLFVIFLSCSNVGAFLVSKRKIIIAPSTTTVISSFGRHSSKPIPMRWTHMQSNNNNNNNNQNQTLLFKLVHAVGSTTSLLVGGSVFCAICIYRNAWTVSLFLGAVSNGIFSKLLKRLLKQQRPAIDMSTSTSTSTNTPNDHGMPSSHAMSLGFIGMFTTASWQCPPTAALLLVAVYMRMSLYYRVRIQSFHTWEQIGVGLVLGSLNGCLWWHWTSTCSPKSPLMTWISDYVLNEQGLLPYSMLWIPLVVGGLTVSSFERKISSLLSLRRRNGDGSGVKEKV